MVQKKIVIRDDLSGKKFNKLIVKNPVPRTVNERTKFLCICECGNEVIIEGSKLKNGHTKSCGCIRKEIDKGHNRKGYGESSKNSLIYNYKHNAKVKGLDFELSNEEVLNLFSQKCYYCGTEPKNIFHKKKSNGGFIFNGIDRKNNTKGYVKENVVTCCSQCNYIKNKQNYDEFIEWIKTVHENLSKNNII